MKAIQLLFITIISLLVLSCSCERNSTSLTFVFDKPLSEGKYPDYFKEITEPFELKECDKCYLLKPINVTRLDIKKAPFETNAWYFEQMGDNTVEFSKNWLSQFYKDSLVNKHLTLPSKKVVNANAIDHYLKKENVLTLIFYEDSDSEAYNDNTIYTSAKDISSKIKESLCGNTFKEIVVLVNPTKLATKIITPVTKPETIVSSNPCDQPTTTEALNLKDAIASIIDTNNRMTERLNLAEDVWAKYCHENAYVALYNDKNDKVVDVWDPGSGKNYFTNRLAVLESIVSTSIFRIEFAKDGRVSGIHIIECQNANELL